MTEQALSEDASAEESSGDGDVESSDIVEVAAEQPSPQQAPQQAVASRPVFQAASRTEALTLIDAVSSWYRVNEPASPIPILLDKGRELANRDFTALMQDMIEE